MFEWFELTEVLQTILVMVPPFVAGFIFAKFDERPLVWIPSMFVMAFVFAIAQFIAEGMR